MKTTSFLLTALTALSITVTAQESKPAPAPLPKVQLALLLDTSGSMSGLINQARTQLWKVVNEFIAAKRDGQTPEVEVALYEYGNSGLQDKDTWIRCIVPLSRDLDKVSQELFSLKTNGGDEYCGAAIRHAADTLMWSKDGNVYKAIFIAGNEPFTQGPVTPADACKLAAGKGIVVNTIHCGSNAEGISGGWKSGAVLADGSYMVIDQNNAIAHIAAPQDAEIVKLSEQLNKTYVRYGKASGFAAENQIAQDKNAEAAAPSAGLQRALTKSCSRLYDNSNWDLVDAIETKKVKLEELKKEELPAELAKLTPEELKIHVERQCGERRGIQQKIQTLNKDREAYVAAELKKQGEGQSLDVAMIKAIRSQAQKQQFSFPAEK